MANVLARPWFWLIDALLRVRWRRWNHMAGEDVPEWNRYIPRLNDKVDAICRNLAVLRSFHRTESGEGWPKDINDRLLTLTDAMNEIGLSKSEQQERTRVQNALIELQSAQETIERHGFPEPNLLAEIHIDLVRARNELDPNQPHDRPR